MRFVVNKQDTSISYISYSGNGARMTLRSTSKVYGIGYSTAGILAINERLRLRSAIILPKYAFRIKKGIAGL